jgi:hypothetical protein
LFVMTHEASPADGTMVKGRRQNTVTVEDVANGAGRDREA